MDIKQIINVDNTYISYGDTMFHGWFRSKRRHNRKNRFRVTLRIQVETSSRYKISGAIYMAGIGNAELEVSVKSPEGVIAVSEVQTDVAGKFELEFVAEMVGQYEIAVTFAGDAGHKASSASVVVEVIPIPPVVTVITLTGPEDPVYVGSDVKVSGVLE